MPDFVEQLRELSELHQRGNLSDEEFQAATANLHSQSSAQNVPLPLLVARDQLVAREHEWIIERKKYLEFGNYLHKYYIPRPKDAKIERIGAVVVGATWTAVATAIAIGLRSSGASAGIWVLPAFGILYILVGLAVSSDTAQKANAYQCAEAHYQAKRAALEAKIRALEAK